MTNIDQEIAIATVCGWTHTKTVHNPDPSAYGRHPTHTADVVWDLPLPDYLNDLNAMHEAEKILTNNQRGDFSLHLQSITGGEWFLCYHATASQRAEAFLKTLNLWKD